LGEHAQHPFDYVVPDVDHVEVVMQAHERVADYMFKTVLRGRVSYDDGVLVLPRARGELLDRVPAHVH